MLFKVLDTQINLNLDILCHFDQLGDMHLRITNLFNFGSQKFLSIRFDFNSLKYPCLSDFNSAENYIYWQAKGKINSKFKIYLIMSKTVLQRQYTEKNQSKYLLI